MQPRHLARFIASKYGLEGLEERLAGAGIAGMLAAAWAARIAEEEGLDPTWAAEKALEGGFPDAMLLAGSSMAVALGDRLLEEVLERLPRLITMLSNPSKYLSTRAAARRTPSLLEKTRCIYLAALQELRLHGAPLSPGEARACGVRIQYTRIHRCPECGTPLSLRVECSNAILVEQECPGCGYKYRYTVPAPPEPPG